MADLVEALRALASSSSLPSASLSFDGKTLTIPIPGSDDAIAADAAARHTISHGGASCTYSLASMYLQIADPRQSLLQYRKACSNAGVTDAVKATDKAVVVGYFLGETGGEAAAAEEAAAAAAAPAASAEGGKPDDERGRDSSSRRDRGGADRDEQRRRREKERHKSRDRSSSHGKDRDRDRSRDDGRRERRDRERGSSGSSGRDRHRDRHRDRDDKQRHHRDREKDRHAAADEDGEGGKAAKKKAKAPVTNEQLMERLDIVVDKRQGHKEEGGGEGGGQQREGGAAGGEEGPTLKGPPGEATAAAAPDRTAVPALSSEAAAAEEEEASQQALIVSCLSSSGFEVRNLTDAIEADRPAVQRITALEIPVGDSASVLRCGAAASDGRRDFSRVLDLYAEVAKAEERAKRGGGGGGGGADGGGGKGSKRGAPSGSGGWDKDSKRARGGAEAARGGGGPSSSTEKPKPTGKPIIIVPNAMTSPITMVNAADFFGGATFVPRDIALKKAGARKRGAVVTIRHRLPSRLGGGEVEFEIVDNPATRLQRSADWDRVVAVVAQGAEWQFKGWRYSKPVDLFGRCYGFYIGIEGAPIPRELKGWNVKIGSLNRDKRGLDSVTYAGFWNGLDEWMNLHKPEYLPQEEG